LIVFRVGKKAGNSIFIGIVKKKIFLDKGGALFVIIEGTAGSFSASMWIEERKKRKEGRIWMSERTDIWLLLQGMGTRRLMRPLSEGITSMFLRFVAAY
jgi:hypothetical protein